MGLETATYIKDLVSTNPTATDFVSQGDDHIRMLKSVLQSTFPSLCGPGLATVGGTANAITLTYSTAPGSNLPGEIIYFTPTATNTGATTISVNGNTALSVYNQNATLVGGELKAGVTYAAMIGANGAFNLIADGNLPLTGGTLTGSLTVAPASSNPAIILNKAGAAAYSNAIFGQNLTNNRWALVLGTAVAESGGQVGSDFALNRYSDAGAFMNAPLTIERATGYVSISGTGATPATLLGGSGGLGSLRLNSATGFAMQLLGQMNGSNRWQVQLGNGGTESGGNVASDFVITRFSDAAALIDTPLTISRASGVATFAQATTLGSTVTGAAGYGAAVGGAGIRFSYGAAHNIAMSWAPSALTLIIDNASVGTITPVVSDTRLKENVAPLEGSLARVLRLQGVSFNMRDDRAKRRQIGLIAQDVAPIVPEVLQEYGLEGEEPKLALDYPKLTALLIEAVKTLTARVEALETQLAGVQHA